MGSDRPLSFGLAGAGTGGGFIAKALKMLEKDDLALLEVVCDSVEEKAKECASAYGVKSYMTDFGEMIGTRKLDAVVISTPHFMHFPMAEEAIEAGINVLLDKPMTVDTEQADELIKKADRKGVALGVMLQNRMSDDSERVRQVVDTNGLGRMVLGEATVEWFRDIDYYAKSPWRGRKASEGGGVLINQAIHTLDLLLWFMGAVEHVEAEVDTLHHDIEVEDVAVASLRFASRALGIVQASTATYPGFPSRLELHGTEGCALFEMDGLTKLIVKGREEAIAGSSRASARSWSKPEEVLPTNHYRVLRDFVYAVREGRRPKIDGREGRRSIELIEAIYESSRSGRQVAIPARV
ncbi:MAG TPA: Gfo/Idh/MocA family oxidoreductase [Thermoproteota archaeon]|nr:Gfo/Idh/MocA family oxidoreductase [Thermoproteota archaeon]